MTAPGTRAAGDLLREKVLALMASSPKAWDAVELHAKVGRYGSLLKVRRCITYLIEKGLVVPVEKGFRGYTESTFRVVENVAQERDGYPFAHSEGP